MDNKKFLRRVDETFGNLLGHEQPVPEFGGKPGEPMPQFGGKPGEPVPTVDPEDVKTVWSIHKESADRHPGTHGAVRSEERRVGKECRARWRQEQYQQK